MAVAKTAQVLAHYARNRAADPKFVSPFAYGAFQVICRAKVPSRASVQNNLTVDHTFDAMLVIGKCLGIEMYGVLGDRLMVKKISMPN